jgi:hypothetical protein
MSNVTRVSAAAAAVALLSFAVPAAGAATTPTVKAKLFEFKIKPKPKSTKAGKVKVVAKNIGTEEHELVVVKGDDAAALPTAADGSVDEDAIPETDKFGEIAEFKPKKTKTKTFDLDAGSYVVFCNVVDDEDDITVSHFAEGMHTILTVR